MSNKIRVSRGHMGDLEAAALNCGNPRLQKHFEEMKKDPGFEIVDNPKPGEFLMDYSILFMYPSEPPIINIDKKSIDQKVQEVINKGMTYDPLLSEADPAIIASWEVSINKLSDKDLEDMYKFNYPKNVEWLIEVRKDFIERCHPEELK